ncbi:hypothetical protein BMR1_03g01465 [Babesia microti strain RI]|uniref:Tail-specific protease n=1 Tax=Babesia microti (strain RI) TaxID=1133968 RepID=A0A1R4ABM8_BABMR|nr:hypothetical protein BMR1_03g01465 [Babesia microti strain RI]SJK86345.1 hypothetical protein BMR1_03g01465 [Babesia microti strain RI]|eukprot:XP_021338514.1 hypothetical protein BMR1_03g01465 [Babesia microti strain RI]
MMLYYLLIINLITYKLTYAISAIDGRENFVMDQPEETYDIALPVLNVYYEEMPKDWKYETQKAHEIKDFEREIDEADNSMKYDALSLLEVIAKERNIISKIKQNVVKKQLVAPNAKLTHNL